MRSFLRELWNWRGMRRYGEEWDRPRANAWPEFPGTRRSPRPIRRIERPVFRPNIAREMRAGIASRIGETYEGTSFLSFRTRDFFESLVGFGFFASVESGPGSGFHVPEIRFLPGVIGMSG